MVAAEVRAGPGGWLRIRDPQDSARLQRTQRSAGVTLQLRSGAGKELDHVVGLTPFLSDRGDRHAVRQGLQTGHITRRRVQDQHALAGLDEELAGQSRFRPLRPYYTRRLTSENRRKMCHHLKVKCTLGNIPRRLK